MNFRVWFFDCRSKMLWIISILIVVGILLWAGVTFWESIKDWTTSHEELSAGLVATVAVIVGFIWARQTVWSMKCQQQLEILLNLGHYWDRGVGMETWAKVKEIMQSGGNITNTLGYYRQYHRKEYHLMLNVPSFFEDIGWLVRKRYIPLSAILSLYKTPISESYEAYKEWIDILRQEEIEKGEKPQIYDHFIWLANRIK